MAPSIIFFYHSGPHEKFCESSPHIDSYKNGEKYSPAYRGMHKNKPLNPEFHVDACDRWHRSIFLLPLLTGDRLPKMG